MTDSIKAKIAEEAADLFLRLRNDPANDALLDEYDAFINRGRLEQKAFVAVERAWQGSAHRRSNGRAVVGFGLAAITALGVGFWLANPLAPTPDYASDTSPTEVTLATGDFAQLDAGSGLINSSNAEARRFDLVKGAVVFEVAAEPRPFVVTMGPLNVTVTGTVFETSQLKDTFAVSVLEGSVTVQDDNGRSWNLTEGMRLLWSTTDGGTVDRVLATNIARWRTDRLVTNGLTLSQVADILDRRTAGRILIPNGDLRDAQLSGIIDLSKPEIALQTLAVAENARVQSLGPLGFVLLPQK
ncbi:MAG: FecR domain-containing protein [Pseudomonadota bacterium]